MTNGESTTSVRVTDLPVDVLEQIRGEALKDGILTDSGAVRRALLRYVRGERLEQSTTAQSA